MKVGKKRRMVKREHSNTLPEEIRERICLLLQQREQEREKDPSQFYLDDPPLSLGIWKDVITVIR